eukprot:UN09606
MWKSGFWVTFLKTSLNSKKENFSKKALSQFHCRKLLVIRIVHTEKKTSTVIICPNVTGTTMFASITMQKKIDAFLRR